MEPGEALSTAAQIAVALAGFAGVVVVFRRESVHDWSPIDKFRLRLLLTNSILPLALCVIGLLLLTVKPAPAGIWRWCSAVAVIILLAFAITTSRAFRRLGPIQLQRTLATGFAFTYLGSWEPARHCFNASTSQYLTHSGRSLPVSSCTC